MFDWKPVIKFCSCVQTAVNALKESCSVRVTRILLPPACTRAALPTVASAVPLTLLTVTVLPAELALMVASVGTLVPPPLGPAGLPLLPHPSMREPTVTSEIACTQKSRREVFGLSMALSLCKQRTRLRASRFAVRYGVAGSAQWKM